MIGVLVNASPIQARVHRKVSQFLVVHQQFCHALDSNLSLHASECCIEHPTGKFFVMVPIFRIYSQALSSQSSRP